MSLVVAIVRIVGILSRARGRQVDRERRSCREFEVKRLPEHERIVKNGALLVFEPRDSRSIRKKEVASA